MCVIGISYIFCILQIYYIYIYIYIYIYHICHIGFTCYTYKRFTERCTKKWFIAKKLIDFICFYVIIKQGYI